MKSFNTEGSCFPDDNYMVDVSTKLEKIVGLIDNNKYFTINRARQYGKTTTLMLLQRALLSKYLPVYISFQATDSTPFSSSAKFVPYFINIVGRRLRQLKCSKELIDAWYSPIGSNEIALNQESDPFTLLHDKIVNLCDISDRGIVLMIDEIDNASNNEVLFGFLGMLRQNYLNRKWLSEPSFQSVILAGVSDIKNLKKKVHSDQNHSDQEHVYNSPWNIAADFDVDMSFSVSEISSMLSEYENDHNTGMDITEVSAELRRLSFGYPYLVSWLCKWMDSQRSPNWTSDGVKQAGAAFLKSSSLLLDDIEKNIQNNDGLKDVLIRLLYKKEHFSCKPAIPPVELGLVYGLFRNDGFDNIIISNPLFEQYLYRYTTELTRSELSLVLPKKAQFIFNNELDMVMVLNHFQDFISKAYLNNMDRLLEKECRLIFMTYLSPIINGTGHCYIEAEADNNNRMDLVVSYGTQEHIVEMKIWDGPEYRRKGISQLSEYMLSRNADTGYLVSFSFLKHEKYERGWLPLTETSLHIYEVIIPWKNLS